MISAGADRVGKVDSAEERGTRQAAGYESTHRFYSLAMNQYLLIPLLEGMNIHLPVIFMFTTANWVTSHYPVGRGLPDWKCGPDAWNPLLFTAKYAGFVHLHMLKKYGG